MKYMNFLDLYKTDFAIHSLTSIYQMPSYKKLEVNDRSFNGFLLVAHGSGTYEWDGGLCEIHPHSLIYLPLHSKHILTVLSESISFYRISFMITDMSDNRQILFSKLPHLMSSNGGAVLLNDAAKLSEMIKVPDSKFRALSLFYDMIANLYDFIKYTSENRVVRAIDYINNHYTNDISVSQLAKLCYISETHLYRLFKKETGKTPTDYRNELRIQRACLLLRETDKSIGEISSELGFDSIYYFSRIFKKYIGKSPSKYQFDID